METYNQRIAREYEIYLRNVLDTIDAIHRERFGPMESGKKESELARLNARAQELDKAINFLICESDKEY